MRFAISRQGLVDMLADIAPVIPKGVDLPPLEGVLFQAETGTLKLTATNRDRYIVKTMAAEVAREGAIVVPFQKLQSFLKALPKSTGTVLIGEGDGKNFLLFCDRYSVILDTIPVKEFPVPKWCPNVLCRFTLTAGQLQYLLNTTMYASAKNDACLRLWGVWLKLVGDQCTAYTSDGVRLAKVVTNVEDYSGEVTVHVLYDVCEDMLRVVKNWPASTIVWLSFAVEQQQMVQQIKIMDTVIGSCTPQEQMPNYEYIINTSQNQEMRLRLHLEDFQEALAYLFKLIKAEKIRDRLGYYWIKATLTDSEHLRLFALTGRWSSALAEVTLEVKAKPTVPWDGHYQVFFDAQQMLQMLKAVALNKSEHITLCGSIKGTSPLAVMQNNAIHIVMPLNG